MIFALCRHYLNERRQSIHKVSIIIGRIASGSSGTGLVQVHEILAPSRAKLISDVTRTLLEGGLTHSRMLHPIGAQGYQNETGTYWKSESRKGSLEMCRGCVLRRFSGQTLRRYPQSSGTLPGATGGRTRTESDRGLKFEMRLQSR